MDIRKVKKLIELLQESGIAEIEISEGEESVRISRYPPGGAVQHFAVPAPTSLAPPPSGSPAAGTQAAAAESASTNDIPGHKVLSPMVGTFYEAPTPDAEPFVRIGSEVKAGDTLCIIEAMKMMNQIEADKAGRIAAIQAINGEPVEYGQTLFIIQ
jgi:acetyl-CoA carboxylase biotin carboxyl carrier protein